MLFKKANISVCGERKPPFLFTTEAGGKKGVNA